jgi:hypothetical protein
LRPVTSRSALLELEHDAAKQVVQLLELPLGQRRREQRFLLGLRPDGVLPEPAAQDFASIRDDPRFR